MDSDITDIKPLSMQLHVWPKHESVNNREILM